MAREALGIVGMFIGGAIGGPMGARIGFALGSIAGALLDPPEYEGPKLGEAPVQTSRDGVPIPIIWGLHHCTGNIIQMTPIVESTKKTGDKKTGYTKTQVRKRSFAIGMARGIDGPIIGVCRVWENNKLIYDARLGSTFPSQDNTAFEEETTIYLGGEDQLPDPILEADTGVGLQPAYRGLPYIVFINKDITNFGSSIPSYRFELWAGTEEVNNNFYLEDDDQSDGARVSGDLRFTTLTGGFAAAEPWVWLSRYDNSGLGSGGRGTMEFYGYEQGVGSNYGYVYHMPENYEAGEYLLMIKELSGRGGDNTQLQYENEAGTVGNFPLDQWVDLYAPPAYDAETGEGVWFFYPTLNSSSFENWDFAIWDIYIAEDDGTGNPIERTIKTVRWHAHMEIMTAGDTPRSGHTIKPVPCPTNDPDGERNLVWDECPAIFNWLEASILENANLYFYDGPGTSGDDPDPEDYYGYDQAVAGGYHGSDDWKNWRWLASNVVAARTGFDSTVYIIKVDYVSGVDIWRPRGSIVTGIGFDLQPNTGITQSPDWGEWFYATRANIALYGNDASVDLETVVDVTLAINAYPEVDGADGNPPYTPVPGTEKTKRIKFILPLGTPTSEQLTPPKATQWCGDPIATCGTSLPLTPVGNEGWPLLGDIVKDVCELVHVTKVDTTEIDHIPVCGFLVAGQYSAADTLKPLQRTYFFDLPERDDKIVAILRGKAAIGTIYREDMVVGRKAEFETAREQGVEFPHKLHLKYESAETDYVPTKATSERRSADVKAYSEITVEVPVNMSAVTAAPIADKMHKVAWAEMEGTCKWALPEKHMKYIPSDVVMVEVAPNVLKRVRIQKRNFVDGIIQYEGVVDRASSYLNKDQLIPPRVDPIEPESNLPVATQYEVMDLPALGQVPDTLHVYVAAWGDGIWNGCTVELLVDTSWVEIGQVTFPSTMGTTLETLATYAGTNPDTANSVLVSLSDDDIASITQAEFDLGANLFLIGDELVNVRDVTAEGANYRLSHFTRGAIRTTIAAHSIGERCVKLESPSPLPIPSSFLGQEITVRAFTFGTLPSASNEQTITFNGLSQTEWKPLSASMERISNDWYFAYAHHRRLGYPNDAVISQHFRDYAIRFEDGAIVRTIYTSDENFIYTEEAQIVDFGAAVTAFDTIEICARNSYTGCSLPATPVDITGNRLLLSDGSGSLMLSDESGALSLGT